ncbi:phage portal protein [Ornithobacterium rhinotracheale]|uniref:phage portal protein n=1 Tax=Ornithobacterium rhinotracheale TaxID=28251 RepID=UPI004035498D
MYSEIEQYLKKAKTLHSESIRAYNSQYDVNKHEIFVNKVKYPDRVIINKHTDSCGKTHKETIIEPLNRIGLAYQKRIVKIGTIFQCGIPYIYQASPDEREEDFYNAFLEVISKNKMAFTDMKLTELNKRLTMCAELWYTSPKPNQDYGFDSNFELKCMVLNPEDYKLYAQFDEKNDLKSFTIHSIKEETETYQVFTAEYIKTYTLDKLKEWSVDVKENAIGKIPIVFYEQPQVEWHDVQNLIEIAERQRTYQSESNKRFGEPILALSGKVQGDAKKSQGGRVLELTEGGSAQFIQPPNANQSFENEQRMNRRDIHEFTQTPDLSDEFFEGKGNMLSGVGRKMAWLPAHLKVLENNSIYISALKRRISIVSSFLELMNPRFKEAVKTLEITPIVTPYDIENDSEMVETLMTANGNKPLISQKTAMQKYGVKDTEAELEQISKENTENFNESAL